MNQHTSISHRPPVSQGYFIAGTDTGIGKSIVTAALLHAFANTGKRVIGMKPVAAGAVWNGHEWENEDVALHAAASNTEAPASLRCPYLLPEPVAPHIAAALEGVSIDFSQIVACHQAISDLAELTIVEGVGGFRVPLTDTQDTADLAVAIGRPVILVVGMRLGCISHALITAEAITARGLTLAGWVANQIDPGMRHVSANLSALKARLPAPLLGHIPHLLPASFDAAAEHIDLSLLSTS